MFRSYVTKGELCTLFLFETNRMVLKRLKSFQIMLEDRKMYPMKCADCGKDSTVPFEPKPDRPVYCKECLPKHSKKF